MVSVRDIVTKYVDYYNAKEDVIKEISDVISDETIRIFWNDDGLIIVHRGALSQKDLNYILDKGFILYELTAGMNYRYVFKFGDDE